MSSYLNTHCSKLSDRNVTKFGESDAEKDGGLEDWQQTPQHLRRMSAKRDIEEAGCDDMQDFDTSLSQASHGFFASLDSPVDDLSLNDTGISELLTPSKETHSSHRSRTEFLQKRRLAHEKLEIGSSKALATYDARTYEFRRRALKEQIKVVELEKQELRAGYEHRLEEMRNTVHRVATRHKEQQARVENENAELKAVVRALSRDTEMSKAEFENELALDEIISSAQSWSSAPQDSLKQFVLKRVAEVYLALKKELDELRSHNVYLFNLCEQQREEAETASNTARIVASKRDEELNIAKLKWPRKELDEKQQEGANYLNGLLTTENTFLKQDKAYLSDEVERLTTELVNSQEQQTKVEFDQRQIDELMASERETREKYQQAKLEVATWRQKVQELVEDRNKLVRDIRTELALEEQPSVTQGERS